MDPQDPYASAIANVMAAQEASAPAPAPALPPSAASVPAPQADPYANAIANVIGAQGDSVPSGEPFGAWVKAHTLPELGAAYGLLPGLPGAAIRGFEAWRGMQSKTRSARAAFKASAPYEDLAAQAPAPAPVEPGLVDPHAVLDNTSPADEPLADPSLVKYTKTQVLNPEALGRQDLEAVNARTASQVQQRLAEIADRAARNARLSRGYVTDPATGLQVPSSVAASPPPPDLFAGLLDQGSTAPTAAQQAATRAVAARETALAGPRRLPAPSALDQMPVPEAAGTAQGALESVYGSPIMRNIARIGSHISPIATPLLGFMGAGANALDAYQSEHEGDTPSAIADTVGALGGMLMIPDNPITPPIGAAMMAIPPAYAAWRHYGKPYVEHKLHDWFGP